jgi:DNA-directed RNA polymerase specialized sigma subunit
MRGTLETMERDIVELDYLARRLTETDSQQDLGIAENQIRRVCRRMLKKIRSQLKGSDGK